MEVLDKILASKFIETCEDKPEKLIKIASVFIHLRYNFISFLLFRVKNTLN